MTGTDERISKCLRAMEDTICEMLKLDLDKEAELGRLADLQSRQEQLKMELEEVRRADYHPLSDETKQLADHCLRLQQELIGKLTVCRRQAGENLSNMQKTRQAKRRYNAAYIQTAGYFVDKHE
ncbi:MAG TPA: hypothetical protein VF260_00725 [Bacilli bacterium]